MIKKFAASLGHYFGKILTMRQSFHFLMISNQEKKLYTNMKSVEKGQLPSCRKGLVIQNKIDLVGISISEPAVRHNP